MLAPESVATPLRQHRAKRVCSIYRKSDDTNISAGAGVYDLDGLCPPFFPSNSNAFGSTFGIEFEGEEAGKPTQFVRPFSAFEVVSCFRLEENLTHSLSHASNFSLLECGIPSATSSLFLSAILKRLEKIRTESFEIVEPRRLAAPAAIAQVPIFTNGAVGSRIPDSATWAKALKEDPMTNLLLDIVANPALADTENNLRPLHHIYRQPARQGAFSVCNGILYMKEIFQMTPNMWS